MSFSTFSGPLRSGTVKDGTVAAGRNTGVVVLSQSYDTGVVTAGVGNVDVQFGNLPQGAQIIDIVVDQVVVPGATTQLAWQTSTSADTPLWSRYAVGAAAGVGRAIITVVYAQRASDGSQIPASV